MSEEINKTDYITQITGDEKAIIKNKTAFGLPDRPSYSGMKPAEIKRAFWSPLIDEKDDVSVLGLLERAISETNGVLGAGFGALGAATELVLDMQNALLGTPTGEAGYKLSADRTYYICTGGFNTFSFKIAEAIRGIPVREIADSAFEDCSRLQSVTIPSGIKKIGAYAFKNCTALREIYYNAVNADAVAEKVYPFYNVGMESLGTTLIVGKDVESIPNYFMFSWAEDENGNDVDICNLTSIRFEEGSRCESIGERAFYQCRSLKQINLPDSVTDIGGHAFRKTGFTEFNFGDDSNLIFLRYTAFCKSQLESITLPKSVSHVGHDVFKSCEHLKYVTFLGTPKKEEFATKNGLLFDENCKSLTDIYVPWSEGDIPGAPWGAPEGVTVHYNQSYNSN